MKLNTKNIIQFVKFAAVGATGTIVDFGFLNLFVLYFGLNVYFSATASFMLAATNNFFLNKAWTFKKEAENKKLHNLYIKYIIIAAMGLFINLIILRICLPLFGGLFRLDINNPLVLNISKAAATLVVVLWNFFGSKFWVFA